jgi:hypothetical protein
MEPEYSLHVQKNVTLNPTSSQYNQIEIIRTYFLKSIFIYASCWGPGFQIVLFSSGFPTNLVGNIKNYDNSQELVFS